jgi:GH24 family phage-related lysozyme (muramidase)
MLVLYDKDTIDWYSNIIKDNNIKNIEEFDKLLKAEIIKRWIEAWKWKIDENWNVVERTDEEKKEAEKNMKKIMKDPKAKKEISKKMSWYKWFSESAARNVQAEKLDLTWTAMERSLSLIKHFEWFVSVSYWDYKQYSYWYGTKAPWAWAKITKETATKQLQEQVQNKYNLKTELTKRWLWNVYDKMWPNQIAALTSFIYNLWPWKLKSFKTLLSNYPNSKNQIAEKMTKYNKASWNILKWLVKRRKTEAELFLNNTWSNDKNNNNNENLKNAKDSLILEFKHWQVDSQLKKINENNIKNTESVFIFREKSNLSWAEMKKISEKLISINPKLKIFVDQEWWKVNRFTDFDTPQEKNKFIEKALNNSWISESNIGAIRIELNKIAWKNNFLSIAKLWNLYNSCSNSLKWDFLKAATYLRLDTLKQRWVNTYWLVTDLDSWNTLIWWNWERSFWNDEKSYEAFGKAMIDSADRIKWMSIYLKHFPGHWSKDMYWESDTHTNVFTYWDGQESYLNRNIPLFEKLVNYKPWKVWLMVWHMFIPNKFKSKFQEVIWNASYVLTDDLWMAWYKKGTWKKQPWKFFTTDLLKWDNITVVDKENTKTVL